MPRKALETRVKDDKEERINFEKLEEKLDEILKKKSHDLINSVENKIDDVLEYKVNKRLKDEEKRYMRNQKFRIFRLNLIILILLGIIGYFSYCLYDVDYFNIRTKVIENNNGNTNVIGESTTNNDGNNKNEEINKEFIIERYKYLIDSLLIEDDKVFELFKNDFTREDISNDLKLKIAYKNIEASNLNIENDILSFNHESLEESFAKIFGSKAELKNETFTYNSVRFMFYNNTYIGLKEESNKVGLLTKIKDVNLDNDNIKFEVVVAKIDEKNKLLNLEEEVVIDSYKDNDLLSFENKLNKIFINFEKVGEDYIFSSIKKSR